MNSEIEHLDAALREAISKSFIPLQTTRVIKREAFDKLNSIAKKLAKALKSHAFISKSLLYEIYGSIGILRNEAPYFKIEKDFLEEVANQLELTLGLILIDESHEDRIPGKPRII